MEKNYLYKYYALKAKRDYHLSMDEIITNQLSNETDPVERKRLCARRSHHRAQYRKYEARANYTWDNMR